MKTYGSIVPLFLTLTLEGEWSASRPYRFTPGETAAGTYFIRDWVGPRAGLGPVERRKSHHPAGNRIPIPLPSIP
jgi:hypothetical protein